MLDEGPQESKQVVRELIDELAKLPRKETSNLFRIFRVRLARGAEGSPRMAKVTYTINPLGKCPLDTQQYQDSGKNRKTLTEVAMAMHDLFIAAGSTPGDGPAPPMGVERQVQNNLQKAINK